MNKKFAYFTFLMNLINEDQAIKDLCTNAILKGATPSYSGSNVIYPIESVYVSPDVANYCVSKGVTIENYFITRYILVDDLASDLPVELPDSSVETSEGESRQLTWQEVQDLPTVSVPPNEDDGKYTFNVTAHIGHRGLTLDEYNKASNLPLIEL